MPRAPASAPPRGASSPAHRYLKALDTITQSLDEMSIPLDLNDTAKLTELVQSCTGTKFISRFSELMVSLALDAVRTVHIEDGGRKEIDIKRYAERPSEP